MNYSHHSKDNLKHNYKLEKRIHKGDLDDELDIISSYCSENKNILLPIDQHFKELIYTIENNDVIIVLGETGCGKTTKIPEFLYKSGDYKIAHILPRKIAAVSVAQRVSKNMGLSLGKEIGYSVRFDYNYSDETKIKFLTEGMFIRELLMDPLCMQYNVIIIDDCHERTINCEMIFGFLKKIFSKRKKDSIENKLPFKIIISSATLDYQCYLKFFPKEENYKSDIFLITGRTFPVDIFYLDKPVKNYVEAAAVTALNIHKNNPKNSGDILVFLTGQEDINLFIEHAQNIGLDRHDTVILPLCAGLPLDRQLEVFAPTPHNKRKIVVSTNVAEASVTIENIAYVVDCGLVKIKFYNSKIDSDALYIIPASKFSLDQRAGRAGRTTTGQCFRLLTKEAYNNLFQMSNPELFRSNLREFILRIKSMGVKNINKFETLTSPDRNTIARALESLFFLGLLDEKTNLTELGLKVCDLPLDPRLGVTLFKAAELKFNCVEDVLIIVSMLSMQNLFHQPKDPTNLMKAKQKLGMVEGDHLSFLNIYKQYKFCKTSKSKFCKDLYLNERAMKNVDELIHNLKNYLKKYNIHIKSSLDDDGEDIIKSFIKGFFLNVAQKQPDSSYRSLRWNINVHIHPTSVLYTILPEFILYNEITLTAKNYVKDVSKIEKDWLMEVASNYYEDKAKKIIQERHKEEVIHQNNYNVSNAKETKLSINNNNNITTVIEKREEAYSFKKRNLNITNNISDNKNRIYMDASKNDFSHYFEYSDGEKEENKPNKEDDNIKLNTINKTIENNVEEEIESITLLRRQRKRK